MTEYERFNKIFEFGKPDRCVRWYTFGFWDEVVEKWQRENGLPQGLDRFSLIEHLGLEYPSARPLPGNAGRTNIPYNPPFEEKILQEDEDTMIVQGSDGIISRKYKKGRSMPQWISFPVKSPDDWERVKTRINPLNHDFGKDYDEKIKNYQNNDGVNILFICGIYAFHRNLLGEENLAYAYYDMPEVVLDMSRQWLKFYSSICEKMIKDMRIDVMLFHEDMAYKTGPLIGPNLFNEFMTPFYSDMINHLKSLKINKFMVDTDGNVDILLPLFRNVGINIMVPFEQAAGNDLFKIREKYPDLVMWGGIDKRVLNMQKDDIKREVYGKVPALWEKGGFIPSIDHSTPPCPMENFLYYLELLREICE